VCAGLVALVGVLLGAGWPTIVVMSAGMAIACVSSLVIYNRRKAAGRD
jgi:membrane-associated phospholipid phosphatase